MYIRRVVFDGRTDHLLHQVFGDELPTGDRRPGDSPDLLFDVVFYQLVLALYFPAQTGLWRYHQT